MSADIGAKMQLPDGATAVKVTERMWVYVTPANGHFPPRIELTSGGRYTPCVPADRLREFADAELDAADRTKFLNLLDQLIPWRR